MSRTRWDADYNPRKDTFHYVQQQDVTEHIEGNLQDQVDGFNGWTPDRSMRKIGSIPPLAFFKWYHENNIANLSTVDKQAELVKFLQKCVEYRTVDKLKHDTANQGHIIIK